MNDGPSGESSAPDRPSGGLPAQDPEARASLAATAFRGPEWSLDTPGGPERNGEAARGLPEGPPRKLTGRPRTSKTRTDRDRERNLTRVRHLHHRTRQINAIWAGKVRTCQGAGPGLCPWASQPADGEDPLIGNCQCQPGRACTCERVVLSAVTRDAQRRFGKVVGTLVSGATVDVMRAQFCGNEGEVRAARLSLINILLSDGRARRRLQCEEGRLRLSQRKAGEEAVGLLAPLDGVLGLGGRP